MKTLIKYVLIALVIYVVYDNWGAIKNKWNEPETKELVKDGFEGTKKSVKKLKVTLTE